MEKFRTEVIPDDPGFRISYSDNLLFMGSCFTNHIGGRMQSLKFDVDINPFGIVYNPLSLKQGFDLLLDAYEFGDIDLGFHNGRWFSYYHHSDFSNADKQACLDNMNARSAIAVEKLKSADNILLSFGTARVYELEETKQIVSNCHKLPAKMFRRRLLSVDEIVKEYTELFDRLFAENGELKIILTLSPIRHWKDGAAGNQLSKAVLLVAIHNLVEKYENVSYFPSYEIMMDDLRDYRYYSDDMLHISPVAVDYIWGKFSSALLDKEALELIPRVEKVLKSMAHRPFDPAGEAHRKFLKKLQKEIDLLAREYPFLDLEKEKLQVNRQLG